MNDAAALAVLAASGLLAVGLTSAAGLMGWYEWLELRRLQLGGNQPSGSRSELARLRARVRRLESIADGVDA